MRERYIPALSGFPDPGERGGGGGLHTGWFEGRTPEVDVSNTPLNSRRPDCFYPRLQGLLEAQTADQLSHSPPLPATGIAGQWCCGFNHKLDMVGAIAHAGVQLCELLNIEEDAQIAAHHRAL